MHAEATSPNVDEFCDDGMSREYAEVVWARYESGSTDLRDIPSLVEQRVSVHNMPEELNDEKSNRTLMV